MTKVMEDLRQWASAFGELFVLRLIYSVAVLLIAFVLLKLWRRFLKKTVGKYDGDRRDDKKVRTLTMTLDNVVKVFLAFIVVVLILDQFGVKTTSIIAAAGIGGVAVAFGAQSLVKDVITGAFLLVEDQFAVGDYITVNGMTGTVISLGLRVTKILDYSGAVHIIPNGSIVAVTNRSKNEQKADVEFRVSYETNLEEIEEVVEDLKEDMADENFVAKPTVLGVSDLGERSYAVIVTAEVPAGQQWRVQRELRQRLTEEFKRRGIQTTMPVEKGGEVFEEI